MNRPITNETWSPIKCALAFIEYADYLEQQLEKEREEVKRLSENLKSVTHDEWCQCDVCLGLCSEDIFTDHLDYRTQNKEDES